MIANRLHLAFAVLTCLGGLVIASGTESETIPAIAVFFSIFGWLFVDWLKLFALPPLAAYAAMGVASVYCVSDFIDWDAPGNHQMTTVALLLVCVQAVLMLQEKSVRIFEQLGVFCLLELVVAAVFNNAINYAMLLVPICAAQAWALSLLSVAWAAEGIEGSELLLASDPNSEEGNPAETEEGRAWESIQIKASDPTASILRTGLRLPRVVIVTLTPAIMIVAAFFFYAIPRITDAAKVTQQGNTLVGFSDEVRLEQLGQMGHNSTIAARVILSHRSTGNIYQPVGGLYLRGAVLETYHASRSPGRESSVWSTSRGNHIAQLGAVPHEFTPETLAPTDSGKTLLSDPVTVQVTCEATRTPALFAIAPYHQHGNKTHRANAELLHQSQRSTLSRPEEIAPYPRVSYSFGTHAFHDGVQTDVIAPGVAWEIPDTDRLQRSLNHQWNRYLRDALQFDEDLMPSLARVAESLATASADEPENRLELAKTLEQHFSISEGYTYTLNLNASPVSGMDPIEQFVSIDRRGHCQYYASALVMMLRSQGIPARIVVGYFTDEYSPISDHFVVRQSHAHAWVEALIDRKHFSKRNLPWGQPESDQYWIRLDPTPESQMMPDQAGRVGQVMDLAQNMWNQYVVDMDASKQESSFMGGKDENLMQQNYSRWIDRARIAISRFQAGDRRGGLSNGGSWVRDLLFSWPVAWLGMGLVMILLLTLTRWRPSRWLKKRFPRLQRSPTQRPSIDFYAETLDQLERVGQSRSPSQTPAELLALPENQPLQKPLSLLTDAFYRSRFGRSSDGAASDPNGIPNGAPQVEQALAELTRDVNAMMAKKDE